MRVLYLFALWGSSLAAAFCESDAGVRQCLPRRSFTLHQASIAPPLDPDPPSPFKNVMKRLLPRGGGQQAAVVVAPPALPTAPKEESRQNASFLQRHPFLSAVSITTINAFLADLLTQLVFEKSGWNKARSALFCAFGFLYQGCAQYAIVNGGWEKLFPGTKPRNVIAKICGMNLISDPLLFMPTFYIFKEFLQVGTLSWGMVKAALLAYQSNALMDWRNSWMVWFPGHAVTYGVMPTHKRIPWMAFLSFFYMCVLSLTRGG